MFRYLRAAERTGEVVRKMTAPAAPKFKPTATAVEEGASASPPGPLAAVDAAIERAERRARTLREARGLMFPDPDAEVQAWDEGAKATMDAAVGKAEERTAKLIEARAVLARELSGQ